MHLDNTSSKFFDQFAPQESMTFDSKTSLNVIDDKNSSSTNLNNINNSKRNSNSNTNNNKMTKQTSDQNLPVSHTSFGDIGNIQNK